ncbi:MAG TPA: hypothetical protein VHB49_16120 [Bradyrhizobium sp.]|nr:hypothetical protein [Bradyrhizobium sp.]
MRVTISLVATALVLMFGSVAMAQNSSTGSSSTSSPSSLGTVPEAPIGHRQPRADQVPDEKNLANPQDPINKEDAILDKKIKSICRGC